MKGFVVSSVTLFYALTGHCQVKFGVFGGINMSSAGYSVKGQKQSTDYKYGFHAGIGYKVPFDGHLYFSPAATYRMLGYKVMLNQPSFPPDLLATDNDTRFHELDLDALLQFDFGRGTSHFFIKLGPTFNFILWGREKYNLATGDYVDRPMKFSVVSGYGRYNVSASTQLGFETARGFVFYVHYMPELFSMNNEDKGPTIQNHLMGITVGKFIQAIK